MGNDNRWIETDPQFVNWIIAAQAQDYLYEPNKIICIFPLNLNFKN
jgi:hypothetical protein